MRHGHYQGYDVTADSNIIDQSEVDDIDVRRIELRILTAAQRLPDGGLNLRVIACFARTRSPKLARRRLGWEGATVSGRKRRPRPRASKVRTLAMVGRCGRSSRAPCGSLSDVKPISMGALPFSVCSGCAAAYSPRMPKPDHLTSSSSWRMT